MKVFRFLTYQVNLKVLFCASIRKLVSIVCRKMINFNCELLLKRIKRFLRVTAEILR